MVPALSPVIELVKPPVPVPSEVQLPGVVGLAEVPQHTPRAVTVAPPSALTLPPLVAVVVVILVIAVVETVGGVAAVVKVRSLP